MKYAIFSLSFLLLPVVASAHHSRAEFAPEDQEIEGEIVAIAWRNPHPVLTVKIVNDAGEEELWDVEGWQSANSLIRKGVTGDVFTVGQHVRAAVRVSGRRDRLMLGTSISLGDGTQAVLRPGFEPYWPDQAVIGEETTALRARDAAAGSTTADNRGLFRVWSFIEREGAGNLPLTDSARQRLAEFDELSDHPLWNCAPVGMPVAMDSTLPIEFVDEGDNILLKLEQNDGTRTIHLNPEPGFENQPATIMGNSVGRWDGDTLIVTTTNSNYPYFDDDGVAKSESMEFVERFSLGADEQTLSWEATMTDPEYFTEPVVIRASWDWVPGETVKPWNCADSGPRG